MGVTVKNGKICYIEVPAVDVGKSAGFYEKVFGWRMRRRGNGATAFDDVTGEVSGAFVTGRPASGMPGLLIYVMVESVAATMEAVAAHGGEIVAEPCAGMREVIARFRDPGGNVLGLYQEPGK